MSLIVLIGAQAVGKMTVGKELEKRINAKLLFNHQTIDLFANYLGYTKYAFELSDLVRKKLFEDFVLNRGNNATNSIIFTVVTAFDQQEDIDFLNDISKTFIDEDESVYFVELVSDLQTRLNRNKTETRLEAKPSKRDLKASERDLLTTNDDHRLISRDNELTELFPNVNCLKINNTDLSAPEVCEMIISKFELN